MKIKSVGHTKSNFHQGKMYNFSPAAVILVLLINRAECRFPNVDPKNGFFKINVNDAGDPLFLTPLIEDNRIDEARQAAEVHAASFYNVKSYSGYFTVDKRFNSNLFFWFFPAENNYETAPVILWLQGGPGASSMYAVLNENGPFLLKSASKTDFDLELNSYSWTKNHSVIYIDNPVQTGFSFTNGGYAQNQTKVGEDLYQALIQFFLLFPELQKNEFYAIGESYAGKYVPAISHTILKKNPQSDLKINLKGLAIGNGLCDPVHQLKYADYLYQIGLIDSNGREDISKSEKKITNYIKTKQFRKAFEAFDALLNGDLNGGNTLFKNLTGFNDYFNYVSSEAAQTINYLGVFFKQEHIRKSIHVGDLPYNDGEVVEKNLLEDMMDSVAPWITELLNNYRVIFYNGQLDIIVAYPLTVNFLKNLKFSGADEYKTAKRHIWYNGNDIAGYVKEAGNMTEVLVRNAGHMVAFNQPAWALDLITKFTRNQPLYK